MEDLLHTTHRPEVAAYVETLRGTVVSVEEFIRGYKALGLPRTSPSKGRGFYRFLVENSYIQMSI